MGTYDRAGRYTDDPVAVRAIHAERDWRSRALQAEAKLKRVVALCDEHDDAEEISDVQLWPTWVRKAIG